MKAMSKRLFIMLVGLAFVGAIGPEGERNDEDRYVNIKESDRMKKARAELHADFERLFRTDQERDKVLSLELALVKQRIATSKDFEDLFRIRFWCGENPEKIIPWLIEKTDDGSFVGLENSADLIIWERIESKDLKFYGHGWVVEDDLFTVAGRASWLLRDVAGERFGSVKPKSTKDELSTLKRKWSDWLKAATQ
jgi:hypothetical protein